jgi:regulator of sigma E protease
MTSHHILMLAGTGTRWLQLFVSLSLLIVLHEFGHFFFAKKFGMRVEKFYLFFDFLFPFSGLFNFSLFKKKKGDTEYGLGWFPLGGYVKIAGMVDESMDKEELAQPPKPWEYRSKPAWQRLFTMLGGIIVNVLVAMIIYAVIFGVWGEQYLAPADATYGIHVDSLGRNLGIAEGDKPLGTDGKPGRSIGDISRALFDGARSIEVLRNGQQVSIPLDPEKTKSAIIAGKKRLFEVRIPAVIQDVSEKSAAARMMIMPGDSIIEVNGKQISFVNEVQEAIKAAKGQPIDIKAIRKGGTIASLHGNLDSTGKLGIQFFTDYKRFFKVSTIHYNPTQAVGKGITEAYEQFTGYAASLKLLFRKDVKVTESVGGIGTFSKIFPTEFDLQSFLMLTAFISIILAFMNLLPIPGLDGGYVIFLLWEIITGKQVSEKVMEVATTIGLVLLLALMLFANGLDILKGIGVMK